MGDDGGGGGGVDAGVFVIGGIAQKCVALHECLGGPDSVGGVDAGHRYHELFHGCSEFGDVGESEHCGATADGVEVSGGLFERGCTVLFVEDFHHGDGESGQAFLGFFAKGSDELLESGKGVGGCCGLCGCGFALGICVG